MPHDAVNAAATATTSIDPSVADGAASGAGMQRRARPEPLAAAFERA
jgi:hypothetical protein